LAVLSCMRLGGTPGEVSCEPWCCLACGSAPAPCSCGASGQQQAGLAGRQAGRQAAGSRQQAAGPHRVQLYRHGTNGCSGLLEVLDLTGRQAGSSGIAGHALAAGHDRAAGHATDFYWYRTAHNYIIIILCEIQTYYAIIMSSTVLCDKCSRQHQPFTRTISVT
jgi:hypothetical protein